MRLNSRSVNASHLHVMKPACLMRAVAPQPAVVTFPGDRWMVVRFPGPHRLLSWAIVGGGFTTSTMVAWHQIADGDLPLEVDPRQLLVQALAAAGLTGAVGLLTSSALAHAVTTHRQVDGLEARCLATVGLGNALRAGDPAGVLEGTRNAPHGETHSPTPTPAKPARHVGTINLCLWLSRPLTDEAFVEAQCLCAEARALAMLQAAVPSITSGLPATGTGTDCQVVAAPLASPGVPALSFVGKHTAAGQLIGAVVRDAISAGVARWKAHQAAQQETVQT